MSFAVILDADAAKYADFHVHRGISNRLFESRKAAFEAVKKCYEEIDPVITCEPPIFYTYYSRPYADALKRNVWYFKRLLLIAQKVELVGALEEFIIVYCKIESYPSQEYLPKEIELSFKIVEVRNQGDCHG